jgi:uncharacterized protein (DUF433 family)
MEWKDYIAADPEVLAGKPVIKGTRISVELILNRFADGWSRDDLLKAYPRVSPDAVQAAFAFAAEVMKDEEYVARGKLVA